MKLWPHSLLLVEILIVILNQTAVHVLYIYFLFLNESRSIIKKMAAINVTLLTTLNKQSLSQKSLLTLRMVRVFCKYLIETSGTFTELFMIKIQG